MAVVTANNVASVGLARLMGGVAIVGAMAGALIVLAIGAARKRDDAMESLSV
jgi:hypothetical protein